MAVTGDYDHLVKLLLLGDSAVGKSSLLMRFCESKFDANFVLTIGVDFKWKQVERENRKLKIQVWDTAGQERFRTITPAYYRAAMGVVICYDITDKASFEHIDYWLQQLEQHGDEGVQRVLVGNKSDLSENRKVTREEGEKLAAQYSMKFFETSAKTGQEVDEAFLSIADEVVKQRYSDVQPNTFQVKKANQKKKQSCQSGPWLRRAWHGLRHRLA
ncbi:RABE1A [Symbiodinium pilosum]|uniref:Ras-related protein Rab-1 n=1 Tax=Symbiodinium pilosum TaxID=2952 RepID=A0A812JE06_SYMPI|nr:RABE1A [Symbiodinium pilosum]